MAQFPQADRSSKAANPSPRASSDSYKRYRSTRRPEHRPDSFFLTKHGLENSALPPPWTVEQIPGGYKVKDANGQSLAYVYGRETAVDAEIAKVLTMDEARRIASNIAKLPKVLRADE
jgi:hypothetical protein